MLSFECIKNEKSVYFLLTSALHPFFRYYEQKLSKNFIKKLKLSIYMGG